MSNNSQPPTIENSIFEDLNLSTNDTRQYRYLTLSNQLKVLLVSDASTEKCSACCDVQIGSFLDPPNISGLAHFLEHMLFMGTEKYPEENEYSVYITSHGGYSNAYTSQENTVYYFDIQNNYFEHALNLFSSFFWCPLFNESSTSRELQAVDNENTKNLQADNWRTYQLLKSFAKQTHPLNKFSTGNLETLKTIPEQLNINLRESLIQFHQDNYSANLMTLVLYGNQSLDTLQQWVEEKFLPIVNKNLPIPRFPEAPYGPEQLGVMIEVVPVKDLKDIEIYVPLPAVVEHYRTKPVEHISHLIGHEGAGSILSTLKKLGWANSLGSSLHTSATDFSIFYVNIGLTDAGLGHISDIVTIFFEYIGMLIREGPQKWIAQEVKETHDLSFRFINKTEPSDYAVKLANAMHQYPKEHIVSGDILIYDAEGGLDYIKHLLTTYFKPNNCAVLVKYKGFQGKTTSEEKWYGTQYNSRAFTPEEFASWGEALEGKIRSSLHLPVPNPFIATDFTLFEISEEWKETHEHSRQFGPVVLEKNVIEDHTIESIYMSPEDEIKNEKKEGECEGKGEAEGEAQGAGEASEAEGDQDHDQEEGEEGEGEEGEDEDLELPDTSAASTSNLLQSSGRSHMVWFLQDSIWKVPKVTVYLSLKTAYAYTSPLNIALCEIFAETVKENLNEFTYYADCAGLHYDISSNYYGFDLSFSGYHDKLPLLIYKTLEELKKYSTNEDSSTSASTSTSNTFSQELFSRLKEKTLRSYANVLFSAPYTQCMIGTLMCLEEPRWLNVDKYQALKSATLVDFQSFASTILKSLFHEIVIIGNMTSQQSLELSTNIRSHLPSQPLPPSLEPIRRSVQLNPNYEYHYRQCSIQTNPNELNSAIENTYLLYEHTGYLPPDEVQALLNSTSPLSDDIRNWSPLEQSAVFAVLTHLLNEPIFDQLRTKEQLGYLVHSSPTAIGSECGFRVIIQSNSRDPLYLDERIEDCLQKYETTLQNLTPEEFESNCKAVIDTLLEKPKNINSEAKQYWSEISKSLYLFTRKKIQAAMIPRLTLDNLLIFYRTFILPSPSRVKFSSQYFGKGMKISRQSRSTNGSKEIVVVDDIVRFKRSLSLKPTRSYHEGIQIHAQQQEKKEV